MTTYPISGRVTQNVINAIDAEAERLGVKKATRIATIICDYVAGKLVSPESISDTTKKMTKRISDLENTIAANNQNHAEMVDLLKKQEKDTAEFQRQNNLLCIELRKYGVSTTQINKILGL
jgi:uncharacterized coiled-coil protein SlyX